MSVEWGSWKDPRIARDVRFLIGLGLVVILAFVVEDLLWIALGVVASGVLVAALMLVQNRRTHATSEAAMEPPHTGPNISRVPAAGLPGFVMAAGFVCMVWFGFPELRPVFLGVAGIGCLVGLAFVFFERRHRVPTSTPLGLSDKGQDDGDEKDATK